MYLPSGILISSHFFFLGPLKTTGSPHDNVQDTMSKMMLSSSSSSSHQYIVSLFVRNEKFWVIRRVNLMWTFFFLCGPPVFSDEYAQEMSHKRSDSFFLALRKKIGKKGRTNGMDKKYKYFDKILPHRFYSERESSLSFSILLTWCNIISSMF